MELPCKIEHENLCISPVALARELKHSEIKDLE
jgi:hypothetical protein